MKKILRHQYYHTKNLKLTRARFGVKIAHLCKNSNFWTYFPVKGVSEYKGIKGNQESSLIEHHPTQMYASFYHNFRSFLGKSQKSLREKEKKKKES